jgi:hypothetical protein
LYRFAAAFANRWRSAKLFGGRRTSFEPLAHLGVDQIENTTWIPLAFACLTSRS